MEHDNGIKERFAIEVRAFILSAKLKEINGDYWLKVVEGILLLHKYKQTGVRESDMKAWYEEIRRELEEKPVAHVYHDLADELQAILIGYYNHLQPDFWKNDLRAFRNSNHYKLYFEILDGVAHEHSLWMKKGIEPLIRTLIEKYVEKSMQAVMEKYSVSRKEITWYYEPYVREKFPLNFMVVFLDRMQEDDYGFVLAFNIGSSTLGDEVKMTLLRSNGTYVLTDERLIWGHEGYQERLDDILYQYGNVSALLVKEYILEKKSQPEK